MDDDQLVEAIRQRATDPERRVDERPSEFFSSAKTMGIGQLLTTARGLMQQAMRAGRGEVDDQMLAQAEQYQASMNRPAASPPLPPPATAEILSAAEARMGVTIPPLLRRLLSEIANGGFGPGSGLIGVQGGSTDDQGRTIEDLHDQMTEGDPDEPSWNWPPALVPVVDASPTFVCIDMVTNAGRVVEFDMEEVEYAGWDASFTEVSPSLHAWLEAWVQQPPTDEAEEARKMEAVMAQAHVQEARRARDMIGKMSIEERRALGLPDEGWERIVWGGVGLNDDESPPG